MIDRICTYLTNKIRKEMPEVDDERAEIIMYGLQNIIGELPKSIIVLAISYLLGIFKLTLISVLIIAPYRCFSGGVHLKTHLGCIVYTSLLYTGTALIGKYVILTGISKYLIAFCVWAFCMIMLKLYAPADTENVPILRAKERRQKQIFSYIILTVEIIMALIINNPVLTSMIIFGDLIQTLTITRLAYKLANNKYGHEVYANIQFDNMRIFAGNILMLYSCTKEGGIKMIKFLARMAEKYAKSTNTACVVAWWLHQPKMPASLIKKD